MSNIPKWPTREEFAKTVIRHKDPERSMMVFDELTDIHTAIVDSFFESKIKENPLADFDEKAFVDAHKKLEGTLPKSVSLGLNTPGNNASLYVPAGLATDPAMTPQYKPVDIQRTPQVGDWWGKGDYVTEIIEVFSDKSVKCKNISVEPRQIEYNCVSPLRWHGWKFLSSKEDRDKESLKEDLSTKREIKPEKEEEYWGAKWEYLQVSIPNGSDFDANGYGSKGWEMYSTIFFNLSLHLFFKRRPIDG